jgi:hypothetical protein
MSCLEAVGRERKSVCFKPVDLPNGANVQGLEATGQSAGGIHTVALQSQVPDLKPVLPQPERR